MRPRPAATLPRQQRSACWEQWSALLSSTATKQLLQSSVNHDRNASKLSSDLQQDKPFLVIERAFFGVAGRAGGPGQGPVTWAATMAFLRLRKLQVTPQVQLLGGDGLQTLPPMTYILRAGASTEATTSQWVRRTERASGPPASSPRMRSRTTASLASASEGSRCWQIRSPGRGFVAASGHAR